MSMQAPKQSSETRTTPCRRHDCEEEARLEDDSDTIRVPNVESDCLYVFRCPNGHRTVR